MIIYKSLTKKQLADDAGVSSGIVRAWCKKLAKEMQPFGYTDKTQQLSPACVRIICEHYNVTPHNATII